MADVKNELMYEILKQIQADVSGLKDAQREMNASLNALRTYAVALQQDTTNIYAILVRHEARLDRIERRLEISEVSA